MLSIEVIKTTNDPRLVLPAVGTPWSAGYDLQAAIAEPIKLFPGDFAKIPTGLKMFINSENIVGLIFPKSGKGLKGYGIKNQTGIIDPDYQGEILVTIINTNNFIPITVSPFEQIAQILFMPFIAAKFLETDVFSYDTVRGEGGFGSTEKLTQ
jgi:dUTP pyrophosphatase